MGILDAQLYMVPKKRLYEIEVFMGEAKDRHRKGAWKLVVGAAYINNLQENTHVLSLAAQHDKHRVHVD